MGITERKEREKAEMRRRIVDAAIDMFVAEGYEKVSIRNIADKIEYSPATIYLYYKDKDELLYDVQAEAFQKLADHFRAHITSDDPLERLQQLVMSYLDFAREYEELYDLMFIIKAPMNSVENDAEWENGQDAFSQLRDNVSACVAKGLIRFTDPMIATLSVWAFAHGFLSLNLRCRIKIAELDEANIPIMMRNAVQHYLDTIKV
ncbi:transcriptional regulator, TetR family [Chitinophaga jiangningensis]|uniref:Transcriptional regulator, TetR family n=1 Tax=Chitinophaga jiangningensis TaxID=1419482 RepID=A0A1M7BQX3_9BACT|nr:TetR/AcrR family transcriptional regulator [Chitinophaga jiangningensis]SHL57381.1 transcriptional regulator, TetR family [Chitinophaga jiangningensis]